MTNPIPRRIRISMSTIYCFAALTALMLSVSAFSDTYNFFFAKPKKGGAPGTIALPGEEDGAEETEESPASPPAAAGAPSAPAVAPASNQSAPIVINNTNTFPSAPAQAPVAPPVAASEKSLSTGVLTPSNETKLRFGISVAHFATGYFTYTSDGAYTVNETDWGGLLSLTYDFTRSFGISGYVGLIPTSNFRRVAAVRYGGELELMPFRINVGKFDIFELGFVGGVSSWMPNKVYGGARAVLNFDERFGITAVARTDTSSTLLEAGLVTHF